MGTCGSKCCFDSPIPSISDPESPHEKTVISSDSPLTTPPPKGPFSESPKNHSKFQIHPCPPIPSSSSSSTTPTSSSTISTSTITTSNATTSYSSSYSTDNSSDSRPNHSNSTYRPPKKKSFSNDFLLSCVENSNIVILDPIKGIKEKPVEPEVLITPSQYLSSTTRGGTASSLRHRTNTNTNTSMRINHSNNAKRARSVSPASRTGCKVIKPDPVSWSPVSSNFTRPRTAEHKSPQRRPVNSQRGSLNALTGPVSRPGTATKRDQKRPTTEKEVKERLIDDGEVVSIERAKTPPPLVEDLNNPLIAMDCFIFL